MGFIMDYNIHISSVYRRIANYYLDFSTLITCAKLTQNCPDERDHRVS